MCQTLHSTLAGDPAYRGLIRAYLEGMPERVQGLRSALLLEDFAKLQDIVHRTKGTGTGYGFAPITERASACVDELRGPARADVVSKLVQELIEVLEAAERSLDGLP